MSAAFFFVNSAAFAGAYGVWTRWPFES